MNLSKSLLVVAMLGGAASAQAALLVDTIAGDASAFLAVYDVTNAQTYDLNLTGFNGLSLASLNTDKSVISIDLSTDPTWNTFKSTLDTANAVWGVGASNQTTFQFTTNNSTVAHYVSSSAMTGSAAQVELNYGRVNLSISDTTNSAIVADANADQGGWATAANSPATFDNLYATVAAASAGIAFGGTGNFFDVSGTTTGSGIHRTFVQTNNDLGTWNLSGNTLTFTPASAAAVPVPAAIWMFGAGLAGLLGLNRRKAAV